MPSSTAKGVPYPVGTDAAASLDTLIQSLATWVDGAPGIASVTTAERNALSGPALWPGRVVYNNQALVLQAYTGSVWTDDVVSVGTAALVNLAVNTAKLAELAVTTSKIADLAVTTPKIADLAVTDAKIASGLDASKITAGILPIARILDASVTNAKLASGIDASKLTTGTLPIARIGDGAITNVKLGPDSVNGSKIADNSINSEHYVDGSIDGVHLAPGIVTSDKFAASTWTALPNSFPGSFSVTGWYKKEGDTVTVYGTATQNSYVENTIGAVGNLGASLGVSGFSQMWFPATSVAASAVNASATETRVYIKSNGEWGCCWGQFTTISFGFAYRC